MSAEDAAAATALVTPGRNTQADAGFLVVVVMVVTAVVVVPAMWRDPIGPIRNSDPTADAYSVPDPVHLPLPATIRFTGTQFVIENRSDEALLGVRVTVNGGVFGGGYRYELPQVASYATATIEAVQFADSDGQHFNPIKQQFQWVRVIATVDGELRSWANGF
jgi:hypothetical protein